jgi:hypothetical protein
MKGDTYITKEMILNAVCEEMGVSKEDIMKSSFTSDAKKGETPYARQLCMALARYFKLGTLDEIGKYYGGRDHATCMHAVKVINNEISIYSHKRAEMLNIQINLFNKIKLTIRQSMTLRIEAMKEQYKMEIESIANEMIKNINAIMSPISCI